ncbi:hypothetical protein M378DRAFT_162804 [Amanita muscaria Koide BX008]|uniref:Uncharacterized protein n=1 Tax=Amanita muscaria (strain Koide BX008) TaxID=946122 RepID=A0A0C2WSK3_AMAMK|nr:hypothetical protein M378DRAFT_162804 [Amanita muscaria Koide BX008]
MLCKIVTEFIEFDCGNLDVTNLTYRGEPSRSDFAVGKNEILLTLRIDCTMKRKYQIDVGKQKWYDFKFGWIFISCTNSTILACIHRGSQ